MCFHFAVHFSKIAQLEWQRICTPSYRVTRMILSQNNFINPTECAWGGKNQCGFFPQVSKKKKKIPLNSWSSQFVLSWDQSLFLSSEETWMRFMKEIFLINVCFLNCFWTIWRIYFASHEKTRAFSVLKQTPDRNTRLEEGNDTSVESITNWPKIQQSKNHTVGIRLWVNLGAMKRAHNFRCVGDSVGRTWRGKKTSEASSEHLVCNQAALLLAVSSASLLSPVHFPLITAIIIVAGEDRKTLQISDVSPEVCSVHVGFWQERGENRRKRKPSTWMKVWW